ncbi:MAG: hypothetical protein ABIK28_13850, partial [Planctomycetota bacterium]
LLILFAALTFHLFILSFLYCPRDRRKVGKSLFPKAAFLLWIAALFAAGTEMGFGCIYPLQLYEIIPDDPSFGACIIEDQPGIRRAQPGFMGQFQHPEFSGIRVEINSWGLRDGLDEATPPAEGDTSVLVLGDSLAFGTGVALEDTFDEQLENHAEEISQKNLRVYNAAVPGGSPFCAIHTLNSLAEKVRPDVVIMALYEGNDFSDTLNTEMRAKLMTPEQREEAKADRLKKQSLKKMSVGEFLSGITHKPFWLGSSVTVQVLFNRFESLLVRMGLKDPYVASNHFLDECLMNNPPYYVPLSQERVIFTLNTLREQCKKLNAELVVLIIPALIQAESERFHDFLNNHPAELRQDYDRLRFHNELMDVLKKDGFLYLDMLDPLEKQAKRGKSGYHREGHWNALGHHLAADLLAPLLAEVFEKQRK